MTQLGFNVNGQNCPNVDALLDYYRRTHAPWALVMDNVYLGELIQQASPMTQVIYRSSADTGREDTYRRLTPEAFVTAALSQIGSRDMWVCVGNESGFSDDLLRWTARVIEIGVKAGLKLAILNPAVGTPEPDDWKRPLALEVLRLASQHRDNVVIASHEYFDGVPTAGFVGGWPDGTNPATGKPVHDNWVTNWPDEPRKLGALWYCGRFQFAVWACEQNNIPVPRFVLTEHGQDDIGDLEAWVVQQGCGKPRGWREAACVWNRLFPQWTGTQTYFEALKYLDTKLYQGSPVEGQLIYSWTNSPDWRSFDVSDAADLLARLTEYGKAPLPPPKPPPTKPAYQHPPITDPRWVIGVAYPDNAAAVNARLAPTIIAPVEVAIPKDGLPVKFIPLTQLNEAEAVADTVNGVLGAWLPIRLDGKALWVWSRVVRFEALPVNPPADNSTAIEALRASVTKIAEQCAIMMDTLNELR